MLGDVEEKTCRDGDPARFIITLIQVSETAFEKRDILKGCDSY